MINIVNLPATPKEFYAAASSKKAFKAFKPIDPISEGLESPESPEGQTLEVVKLRKEYKRSLSSPALFGHPKLPQKTSYLPDGRKSINGIVEPVGQSELWKQLLTRSISKKIEDMIESPIEMNHEFVRFESFSSYDGSVRSTDDNEPIPLIDDDEPVPSPTESIKACMFLLRKPNSNGELEEGERSKKLSV